jgi:hypothetical protein
MRNLKKSNHVAASGRVYEIETYEIAGGRLTTARVRRGSWSQSIDLTWGLGAHFAAAAFAARVANEHDAALNA